MQETKEAGEMASYHVFSITGLDCPDCAVKLEKAIGRIPGVSEATMVFITGKLNVRFDPGRTGAAAIINRVQELGYQAREEKSKASHQPFPAQARKTSMRLSGLDCPDCAAKLEKRINMIPGVEGASVNFGASRLEVIHHGPVTEILEAVRELGYVGQPEGTPAKSRHKASIWENNRYALPTAVSGAVILLAALLEWIGLNTAITHAIFASGIILGGYQPARSGWTMLLRARQLDMNALMIMAAVGAMAIGQFEEGAVVVFLFSLGNALQAYTLDKTRNSIRALMELTPNEALVLREGVEMVLPVEEIRTGDIVIIRPGERIPMDGKVIAGSSMVNQAPITGESIPVEKQAGDEVFAGTINERGSLEIRVTRQSKDNTISRIINLVEEAQAQRAPSQQLVDRFAKYYTPLVIFAAVLVAVVPPLGFGQPFNKWFYEALAMLLVACPCALVISTPVSIVSAIGSAARNGVLIKGGAYLEEAGALSVVAFDKTGTLTWGKPQVTDVIAINSLNHDEMLSVASGIESRSEHPLAEAIVSYARKQGIEILPVADFQAVTGKGAQGVINGKKYYIGNIQFFNELGIPVALPEEMIERLQDEGKTVMVLWDEERVLGLIAVADTIRPDSKQTIKNLKQVGIKKTVMLTGDNQRTARAIASSLGMDEFKADLLPEDKMEAIKELLTRYSKVAMVGDGVNDAPAMAASTLGIAMGVAGTDTALEAADIALMADDLSKLPFAIELSRRSLRVIKQNIAFSLVVKGMILLLVIPGWLTLWLAVAGDMGSSLLVILNGMRLLKFKYAQ